MWHTHTHTCLSGFSLYYWVRNLYPNLLRWKTTQVVNILMIVHIYLTLVTPQSQTNRRRTMPSKWRGINISGLTRQFLHADIRRFPNFSDPTQSIFDVNLLISVHNWRLRSRVKPQPPPCKSPWPSEHGARKVEEITWTSSSYRRMD